MPPDLRQCSPCPPQRCPCRRNALGKPLGSNWSLSTCRDLRPGLQHSHVLSPALTMFCHTLLESALSFPGQALLRESALAFSSARAASYCSSVISALW